MNATLFAWLEKRFDVSITRLGKVICLHVSCDGPAGGVSMHLTHEQLRQVQAEIEAFLQDEALAIQEDVIRQELPA